jgi:hypothetical protein
MGTHAMIGIWDAETGEVSASYVHYDGYVEGVGAMLMRNYPTSLDAWIVATGGYLSSLTEDYEESKNTAVHSDKAVTFGSVEDFLVEGYDLCGAEYIYLWDGAAWFVAMNTLCGKKTLFEEVEMNLRVGVDPTP